MAAATATALCLPQVDASPINVDEALTLTIARRSLGSIWHVVWGQRGGGPLHFFLEHGTLAWPGGLAGLRAPSLLFFLAALPATALVAREVAGDAEAALAVVLLGAAPLAVAYGTFGRPHMMLVAWLAWATWLAVRAGRDGGRARWVAAGAALGATVFVHPTAPLYAVTLLAAALVRAQAAPRRLARDAWPGVVVFGAILVPYWLHSLRVLKRRYGVGSTQGSRTYSGRSVVEDAASAVTHSQSVVNVLTVLAVVGLVALAVRRWRSAVFLALPVAAPVVFFSVVPAGGTSGVFFDRYMLPALPAFLVLVAAGVVALASRLGRARVVAAAAALAVLLGLEVRADLRGLRAVRGLELGRVAAALRPGDVLFAATGPTGPRGDVGYLSPGRPPKTLDRYVALRRPSVELVDDDTCVPVVRFLRGHGRRTAVWLFYAPNRDELAAARAALPHATLVAPNTLAVRATAVRRALVQRGLALRRAWLGAVPRDAFVRRIVDADTQALTAPRACRPSGQLGDPDTTARP